MPRRAPVKSRRIEPRKAKPRPSRRITLWLGASSVVLLAVVIVLRNENVPLGQGSFRYLYSPFYGLRLVRTWPALVLSGFAVAALWMWSRPARGLRMSGAGVAATVAALLAVWTWWAPPHPITQHTFNLSSPSHEGAFLFEALHPGPISQYLRTFDRARLPLPVEKFGSTRVVSNPPGTTILFRAIVVSFPPDMKTGNVERWAFGPEAPQLEPHWSRALHVSLVLGALWALSALTAYGLGREFLSPVGAATFAAIAFFNPSAVLFNPGKDPAQLLTITAMLWAWFAGWRRGSVAASALAGALLVVGATMGLIHVWVAVAAAGATAWHTWATERSLKRIALRNVLPAALGAAAVVLVVYVASGWNIVATLWAVWRRFAEVQPTFKLSRPIWMLIGLPIFLLFLSPGLVTAIALAARRFTRGGRGLGFRLFACTLVAMGLTYVIGVPYELPRLWVAFVPPLALGAMLDVPLFRGRSTWRTFQPLAAVVAAQVLFTAVHWTMFDVRESEYRLMSQRLWTAAPVPPQRNLTGKDFTRPIG